MLNHIKPWLMDCILVQGNCIIPHGGIYFTKRWNLLRVLKFNEEYSIATHGEKYQSYKMVDDNEINVEVNWQAISYCSWKWPRAGFEVDLMDVLLLIWFNSNINPYSPSFWTFPVWQMSLNKFNRLSDGNMRTKLHNKLCCLVSVTFEGKWPITKMPHIYMMQNIIIKLRFTCDSAWTLVLFLPSSTLWVLFYYFLASPLEELSICKSN